MTDTEETEESVLSIRDEYCKQATRIKIFSFISIVSWVTTFVLSPSEDIALAFTFVAILSIVIVIKSLEKRFFIRTKAKKFGYYDKLAR